MIVVMLILLVLGIGLLLGAPLLVRMAAPARRDPVALVRLLQVVGVLLLVLALLARPHDTSTSAFPPPPDQPGDSVP
ncbi:MAG TPA: hypothetical protein VFL93_14840 [Longimicrobiaceae bacterium]|nr:hypothetical protein [Longimicrobiaceae bacterium]